MKELYNIIADVFEINAGDVNDNSGPSNIEKWDSLGQLALIGALENHYKITLEIEEIFEIFEVGDIKRILAKKGVLSIEK